MDKLVEDTEDFSITTEIEDSLRIANKEWNRIINAASKMGYREGIQDGSDSIFQEGFDIGYEAAFETAFILGKFKTLINAMPENIKHPADINDILDKTGRGACYVCILESQHVEIDKKKSFSQIANEHKIHSRQIIEKLSEYFKPIMKQVNIDTLDLMEVENNVSVI